MLAIWYGFHLPERLKRDPRRPIHAAHQWLKRNPDDGIVNPVRLELPAGTKHRDELRLTEEFLELFPCFDTRRVLDEDWDEAKRLLKHVPSDGKARGVLDYLIRAVCNRLRLQLHTEDKQAHGSQGT